MRDLLDAERRRYTDLLDTLEVTPEAPERMRAAARKVDDLRFAATRRAPEVAEVADGPEQEPARVSDREGDAP